MFYDHSWYAGLCYYQSMSMYVCNVPSYRDYRCVSNCDTWANPYEAVELYINCPDCRVEYCQWSVSWCSDTQESCDRQAEPSTYHRESKFFSFSLPDLTQVQGFYEVNGTGEALFNNQTVISSYTFIFNIVQAGWHLSDLNCCNLSLIITFMSSNTAKSGEGNRNTCYSNVRQ